MVYMYFICILYVLFISSLLMCESMWKAHWSTTVVFNSAIQINCHCHC